MNEQILYFWFDLKIHRRASQQMIQKIILKLASYQRRGSLSGPVPLGSGFLCLLVETASLCILCLSNESEHLIFNFRKRSKQKSQETAKKVSVKKKKKGKKDKN